MTTKDRKAQLVSRIAKAFGITEVEAIARFQQMLPTFTVEDIEAWWKSDTFEVRPFSGRGFVPLDPANLTTVFLGNPAGSGVLARVTSVNMTFPTTGRWDLRIFQNATIAPGGGGTARDGRGFSGSVGALTVESGVVAAALGNVIASFRGTTGTTIQHKINIILAEFDAIFFTSTAVNVSTDCSYDWLEYAGG